MSKQRTSLVAYDAKDNPLTHPEGQRRFEEDHDWTVEHAFRGIWVVRTVLPPEVVVRRVSGIRRPTVGAQLIVVPLSKKCPVHINHPWPSLVQTLKGYLARGPSSDRSRH